MTHFYIDSVIENINVKLDISKNGPYKLEPVVSTNVALESTGKVLQKMVTTSTVAVENKDVERKSFEEAKLTPKTFDKALELLSNDLSKPANAKVSSDASEVVFHSRKKTL